MTAKNVFGGGNPNSIYTPMSELEQEVVARLVESGDLRVNLVGWGHFDNPRIIYGGDARIQVHLPVTFTKPDAPVNVHHFDLELVTQSGRVLFRDRQSTEYGGKPIQVAAGVFLQMIWDIQVRSIDPKLVKEYLPGAVGLTSRLQDKDSKDFTLTGNMRLDTNARKLLRKLRDGEAMVKNLRPR